MGLSAAVIALALAIFLVFYIVFAVLGVLIARALTAGVATEGIYSAIAGCLAQTFFAPVISAILVALYDRLLSTAVQEA
jgi:hypothetical protein